jgi:hypothetical protein
MPELNERIKLSLKVNGINAVDAFKKNSLYFLDKYSKSSKEVLNVPIKNLSSGGFYFLHYLDESKWMQYSPIFLVDFKKFEDKIILLAINFNFIPLEVRVMIFDPYIQKKDIDENRLLKVDYEFIYNLLRKFGFEYALMEYDASRIKLAHKISMDVLPRFLYHQHPINIYDPDKLMQIWNAKIEKRDQRHKEIILSTLDEFYKVSEDLDSKFDVLKGHIQRLQRNMKKYN